MAAFMAVGMITITAQSAPALSALTVPVASLPEGCQLTPPPPEPTSMPMPPPNVGTIVIASKRLQEFPSNPWLGSDYMYVAKVRQAFERGPAIRWPDGPPLDPKQANKLAWTLKGDIAEAYRASYETTTGETFLVHAVRYKDAKWATPEPQQANRIVRGSTVIRIDGRQPAGCLNVVWDYIQSLK